MKKILILILVLCCLMLCACSAQPVETTIPPETTPVIETEETVPDASFQIEPQLMRFNVYTPNENFDGFLVTEVVGEALSPTEELKKAGVLNEDVQINYVRWDSDSTTVTVDLNSAFRDQLNTQGSAGEKMLMGCVVNTFLSAYEARQIYITVDGETLETGHMIYDFPISFMGS